MGGCKDLEDGRERGGGGGRTEIVDVAEVVLGAWPVFGDGGTPKEERSGGGGGGSTFAWSLIGEAALGVERRELSGRGRPNVGRGCPNVGRAVGTTGRPCSGCGSKEIEG